MLEKNYGSGLPTRRVRSAYFIVFGGWWGGGGGRGEEKGAKFHGFLFLCGVGGGGGGGGGALGVVNGAKSTMLLFVSWGI